MKLFKIMGNIISHTKHSKNSKNSKHNHSKITKIPEFEHTKEELLNYLSNNVSDIDRQHMHHFFKRYLFDSNFSSPIEDELIQGGCKVLDVG